jgi:hypothetical protein
MPENLQQLITKYHAFYEVSPYNIVIEEGHGSPTATRYITQAGFDVDVHGLSNKSELELPPPAEYAFGYAELKKIADAVSHHRGECSIEVIPFPSTVFSDARRHFQSEAVLRIRISHYGGVDQHAGLPEQHALEEVEKQLQDLGVARR